MKVRTDDEQVTNEGGMKVLVGKEGRRVRMEG